jgi:surfeit locus 1 family protein
VRISRFPDLWRFLLISAAALICVAATASLGFWQLGRAAQKQAVFDAITRQQALQPWHNAQLAAEVALAANSAGEAEAHLLHRPVQLQGQWLAEQTVFLDNRQMQGRPASMCSRPSD